MCALWGSLAGVLLYLELVYHFSGFGWSGYNPILTAALIVAVSGVQTLVVGLLRGRLKKIVYFGFIGLEALWVGAQLVYLRVFRQPLLLEAMFRSGGDALTEFWQEAIAGIISVLPSLVLLGVPAAVAGILLRRKKWELPDFSGIHILRTALVIEIGIVSCVVILKVGKSLGTDFYEDYAEFYDPLGVAENMGVLPLLQRDFVKLLEEEHLVVLEDEPQTGDRQPAERPRVSGEPGEQIPGEEQLEEQSPDEQDPGDEAGQGDVPEEIPVLPQQFNIDYDKLYSLADNNKQIWLADYIKNLVPTNTNEYTGMFEGYSLIFLTAEGFSPYVIREDLTPTLYRLANTGFVFENYYAPLWQTSTSDGEYINLTAMIPDGQYSMRKSSENDMAYVLPKFFAQVGAKSYAYHNNSLSYYDRHLSHPNLGYDFKACKLGDLSESEWGNQIFPMENPDYWPASDLEMVQGTLPEYINEERFHVYYLTVSGHMNYNFLGNRMAKKNREAVDGLDMTENAKAYLACNIELDKALEYLLAELEAAGKLENTVICLAADHYPYGMTDEQYEEVAGKDLSSGMDLYRNSLILWNGGMEAPVYVDKVCGPMDIVPTLLNLLGFDYDSRMYAGRDILSDAEGMVIFNDRSFVTDFVIYKRKTKEAIWTKDELGNDIIPEEQKEAYLARMQQEVKERYQFSAYVLQEDYYRDVQESVLEKTVVN